MRHLAALGAGIAILADGGGIPPRAQAQTGTVPKPISSTGTGRSTRSPTAGAAICYLASEPASQQSGNYSRRDQPGGAGRAPARQPAARACQRASGLSLHEGQQGRGQDRRAAVSSCSPTASMPSAYDADDRALIDAMKRGSSMTVRGTSARGTYSLDTYSLKRLHRRHRRHAGRLCQVRRPRLKPLAADGRPSLIGLGVAGLEIAPRRDRASPSAHGALRARQLFHWLYHRGAGSFEAMTTLPRRPARPARRGASRWHARRSSPSSARPTAPASGCCASPTARRSRRVFIPEDDRGALCVSTQVGCTLTCTFCHTGTHAAGAQPGRAPRSWRRCWWRATRWASGRPGGDGRLFTNVVVMGMGEPLFNYDAPWPRCAWPWTSTGSTCRGGGSRVSTSGVVPRIEQLGADLGVGLAISLHAVRDELRDELVPINRKWNIATLLDACRSYPLAAGRSRSST